MSGYVRTGRGGAGNMISQQEVLHQQKENLEAGTAANELAQEELEAPPPEEGAWRHMGRGGAGNWYTPSELQAQGKFTASQTPTEAEPTTSSSAAEQRPWRGRGGAGNYALEKPADPEQIELQERQKVEAIEEEVRKQVDGDGEGALRRPESAYLAPAKD